MPLPDLPDIPAEPGCYLFRGEDGEILYIGKARNLRHRVSGYFREESVHPRIRQLQARIRKTEFIVTNNEVEALVLENNLIKRHQPRYNINLKDGKSYAYIQLSDDEFPRIGIARRPSGTGQLYGPFVSARERNQVLRVVKTVCGLRSCRRMPRRPCLRYHLHSCLAPCTGEVSREAYLLRVDQARAILRGETAPLISILQQEMEICAERQEYERALEIRDRIHALRQLGVRQHVERPRGRDQDVIQYLASGDEVTMLLFQVQRGRLTSREEYQFPAGEHLLEEFLLQYYSDHPPPAELILPEPVDPSLAEFLSRQRGGTVTLTVPRRGPKRELLDLAWKNVELAHGRDRAKGEALRQALGLAEIPRIIECFDISHTSGTLTVGSMVRFREGRPDRPGYRRFRIRSPTGTDDLVAMREVIRRRYVRLIREEKPLPDLIVVDGGPGQLRAAGEELSALAVTVPVIAIAKREEEIYRPGRVTPLSLDRRDRASLYVQEIRDEAHRFAHAYHTLLRKKEVTR